MSESATIPSIASVFLDAACRFGGGTSQTQKRMLTTFYAVESIADDNEWGAISPSTLTTEQFIEFVRIRKFLSISQRSLENEASHIRRALRGVGRDDFSASMTNAMLGIELGDRATVYRAVDPKVLEDARAAAPEHIRLVIDLCTNLGLQLAETLCTKDTLKKWKFSLEYNYPVETRRNVEGRNCYSRSVFLYSEESKKKALKTVNRSLDYLKRTKRKELVNGVSHGAKMRSLWRHLKIVGLSGENAVQSLRVGFVLREYAALRAQNESYEDACKKLARSLGHLDEDHRWIWHNYLAHAPGIAGKA